MIVIHDSVRRGRKRVANEVVALDVFCGAGGLSLGLQNAGITVEAGIDLDPICKYPFTKNVGAKFILADIATIPTDALRQFYASARIRVLAGCAPCQPFSGYTSRTRSNDGRWQLLLHFFRLASELRPEIITVENVPRLSRHPVWQEFINGLNDLGYWVEWRIVDAALYGVPQARQRLVLLASNLGRVEIPSGMIGTKTVRDAIGNLAPVNAGERNARDRLHASRSLTSLNLERIRSSKPAGTWRDWPDELRAACHTRASGRTYPSVYGRMSWDRPSPTITTQFYGFGNGRFGHPEQDRALTLREGAILQSFPRSFKFVKPDEPLNFRAIGRLIGNAVPPRLAQHIGATIMAHVGATAGASSSPAVGREDL